MQPAPTASPRGKHATFGCLTAPAGAQAPPRIAPSLRYGPARTPRLLARVPRRLDPGAQARAKRRRFAEPRDWQEEGRTRPQQNGRVVMRCHKGRSR
jgi:hypothetical protein